MNIHLKNTEEKVALLKIIAHPIRLEILEFLSHGPACASTANEAINIPQPNLSQHLRILKDAKLIDCCIDGQRRCYSITCPSLITELLALLKKGYPLEPCNKN